MIKHVRAGVHVSVFGVTGFCLSWLLPVNDIFVSGVIFFAGYETIIGVGPPAMK